MPDDPSKRGKPDRDRINVKQRFERIAWATKFGVTQGHLRAAAKQAGPMVSAIKAWLIEWIKKA